MCVTFMYDVFPLLMCLPSALNGVPVFPADSCVCGNERERSDNCPPRTLLINYPLQPKHQTKQFFQEVTDELCPKEFAFSDVY